MVALSLIAGSINAQECPLYGVSTGQLFSARLTVQAADEEEKVFIHHPQKDDTPTKIGTLKAGIEYRIRAGHYRFGWPQDAAYVVMEGEKEVLRTEPTYEPIAITLQEGQTLRAEFPKHYEPYDGRLFEVQGVTCCIILPRPYWYQDVQPGQFKGPEAYPNSLFFLVDDEWGFGEDRCLADLAENAATLIKGGEVDGREDFRLNHIAINIALSPDGKHAKSLLELTEEQLRKELEQGLKDAWSYMKKHKAYRPFDGQSGAAVALLKQHKLIPDDWPNNRTYITYAEALEFAKEGAKKWREQHPDRAPKK